MAGKAPGPRRLDEDEVGKLDAKVVVIQEGPLDGCLRKADQVDRSDATGGCPPEDVPDDVDGSLQSSSGNRCGSPRCSPYLCDELLDVQGDTANDEDGYESLWRGGDVVSRQAPDR